MLFDTGRVLVTCRVAGIMEDSADEIMACMDRHIQADWGDLSHEDRQANDHALGDGGRLLSAYNLSSGVKIWIITEADRSSTTILLPEEY